MRIAKLLFSISLILLSALCIAQTAQQRALDKLDRAATREQAVAAVKDMAGMLPDELYGELKNQAERTDWRTVRERAASVFAALELTTAPPSGKVSNPTQEVKEILRKPGYRDSGPQEGKNWLSRALETLGRTIAEWIESLFRFDGQPLSPPRAPSFDARPLFNGIFIILGIVVVAFAAFFVVRVFSDRAWGKRRLKAGLMDDDEPDRTADEWLAEADRLEQEGKVREAVRCLYLACLVRLDEAGVARFIRAETNWEHCRRIMASSVRPTELEFREPTRRFDVIWYGGRGTADDIPWFRTTYTSLVAQLKERLAA